MARAAAEEQRVQHAAWQQPQQLLHQQLKHALPAASPLPLGGLWPGVGAD